MLKVTDPNPSLVQLCILYRLDRQDWTRPNGHELGQQRAPWPIPAEAASSLVRAEALPSCLAAEKATFAFQVPSKLQELLDDWLYRHLVQQTDASS